MEKGVTRQVKTGYTFIKDNILWMKLLCSNWKGYLTLTQGQDRGSYSNHIIRITGKNIIFWHFIRLCTSLFAERVHVRVWPLSSQPFKLSLTTDRNDHSAKPSIL